MHPPYLKSLPSLVSASIVQKYAFALSLYSAAAEVGLKIAETMGCCGRLAEKLFRMHAKMSILDAIHQVRMDKAFYLLKNRAIPIDAIPFQCGYGASPAFLKTYFKKQTGMTMREWRNKNR